MIDFEKQYDYAIIITDSNYDCISYILILCRRDTTHQERYLQLSACL